MSAADVDDRVRARAFDFLRQQTDLHGEILSHAALSKGFEFEGRRVPLLGPQGIFKPVVLSEMPPSIMTRAVVAGEARPYQDEMGPDGFLRYRYRGTDAAHRDNVGLRLAMRRGVPLVYLFGVTPGRYMPVWPVFIVRDHPHDLAFSVAVDSPYMAGAWAPGVPRQGDRDPAPGRPAAQAGVRHGAVRAVPEGRLTARRGGPRPPDLSAGASSAPAIVPLSRPSTTAPPGRDG